jgi:hypothetical protein
VISAALLFRSSSHGHGRKDCTIPVEAMYGVMPIQYNNSPCSDRIASM